MSSASIKVSYFNARGRAELTRILLADAGVEFEDVRLDKEAFVALKPSLPNGQLPVLEVDGKVLAQSAAMAQYVAAANGFYTGDTFTDAKINELHENVRDEIGALVKAKFSENKDEELKKFITEVHPKWLKRYEVVYASNTDTVFSYADKPTLGDYAVFQLLDELRLFNPNSSIPEDFPNLKKFVETMYARPRIAAWLEKRPASSF
jgi:prostaglandin-H2 D-isomerase / glutathione transferase